MMMRLVVQAALVVFLFVLSGACASVPSGSAGAEADALAHTVEQKVDKAAWDATPALRFGFRGMRTHTWDKARGFVHIRRGVDEIWIDTWDQSGLAQSGGRALEGEELDKRLKEGWAWFINDSFWLNPLVKLFDPGTTRLLVPLDPVDGKPVRGLLVQYASGGVTPGDAYLWIVDEAGEPLAVRMWVSVLPAKGIEFSWSEWVTLKSGARVATTHAALGVVGVTLDDVAAIDLSALPADPFAALAARR